MATDLLLPDPDEITAPFWAGCAEGELRVQRCDDCGRWRFPPRPMCPACRSFAASWTATAGRGTIWSFVVAHPPLLPAYAEHAPYPVVVVQLDEDPELRMVGNVVAAPGARIDSIAPADLAIGQPVSVTFEPVDADWLSTPVALPRWVLG
jgi:uncharacterized OB-fold protein